MKYMFVLKQRHFCGKKSYFGVRESFQRLCFSGKWQKKS